MKRLQTIVKGYAWELVQAMNQKGMNDSDIVRAGIMEFANKVLTDTERAQAMNRAKSNLTAEVYEKMVKEMNVDV